MANSSRRGGKKDEPSASENTDAEVQAATEPEVEPATTPEEAGETREDPAVNAGRAGSSVNPGDLPGKRTRADFIRAQEAAQWGPDAAEAVGEDDPDKADLIQRVHDGERS